MTKKTSHSIFDLFTTFKPRIHPHSRTVTTTGVRNSETGFIIETYQNRNSIYWILIPINDSELRLTGAGGFIIFLSENAFLLFIIVLRAGRTLKSKLVRFSIS